MQRTVLCGGSSPELFYCFRMGSRFTVLERDLCTENTMHCGGNGSCVKLFYCFRTGYCFTVLEPDLVLLF